MLYLSSLSFLNEYNARNIFKNGHTQHQLIMSLFENQENNQLRSEQKILWRRESRSSATGFLIQSTVEPDLSWVRNHNMRANLTLSSRPLDKFLDSLIAREMISYKTTVNPVRTQNGSRVPVRGRENILEWWKQKSIQHGLHIVDGETIVDVNNTETVNKPTGHEIVLNSATIVGRATVSDSSVLRSAVENGIGKGKAYGFGLLSLSGAG